MPIKVYLSPENRVAPHGKYAGYDDIYENEVAVAISALTKIELERCGFEVKEGITGNSIRNRVAEAIAWDADYYMPIHTNASGISGKGKGPEVLAYSKVGSKSYNASKLCYDRLMEIYPRKTNRGVVINNTFYEIISTPMLSVYPELAFHDDEIDAKWLVENKESIAAALCKGVCDWFGVEYVSVDNDKHSVQNVAEFEKLIAERDNAIAEAAEWKAAYVDLMNKIQNLYDTMKGGN